MTPITRFDREFTYDGHVSRDRELILEVKRESDLALFAEVGKKYTNITSLNVLVYLGHDEDYDFVKDVPVTDDLFVGFGSLTNLKQINIKSAAIQGNCFRYITSEKLRRIFIRHCTITDEFFSNLSHLKNLRMLVVHNDFKTLIAPDLGLLAKNQALGGCDFTMGYLPDQSFDRFPELPNLDSLRLDDNCLTGENFQFLERLPKLKSLSLRRNPLTTRGIETIARYAGRSLEELNFSECPNVCDEWIKHLSGMDQLQRLHFEEANLTNACVSDFLKMQNLQFLALDGCETVSKKACRAIHRGCPNLGMDLPNGRYVEPYQNRQKRGGKAKDE